MVIPVFISVRTASKRLPKKCLLPFGDGNVLQHVIKRARFFGFDPIVCTTEKSEDNIIIDIARGEEVKCFRGDEKNKIKRWVDCCDRYNIDKFHTVNADCPFFDKELIEKSMNWLDEKKVDVVYPTKNAASGGGGVDFSFRKDILIKALGFDDSEDTEMVWKFIEKVPGLRFARLKNNTNPPMVRLTLDYVEDYILLRAVERLVGTYASRVLVVDELFRRNPDLYRINWFRNSEWKKLQDEWKPERGIVNG